MNPISYQKYFLQILIGALSVSALIGIYIFLAGDFGETEVRLLFTTLAIGGYSLAGLCCSVIYKREKLKPFSVIGMLTAVTGFVITTGAIWEVIDIEDIWKTMVISSSCLQLCLMSPFCFKSGHQTTPAVLFL